MQPSKKVFDSHELQQRNSILLIVNKIAVTLCKKESGTIFANGRFLVPHSVQPNLLLSPDRIITEKAMILGIGVDILHLPRLKGLLSRRPDQFLTRILTEVERNEFKVLQEQAGGGDQEGPLRYLGAR